MYSPCRLRRNRAYDVSNSWLNQHWRITLPRICYAVAFFVVLAVAGQPCFSQSTDQRLSDALAEITLLKRVVAEQDRRIAELEKAVGVLQRAAKPDAPMLETVPQPSADQGSAPWKSTSVWKRLKDGMSRSQTEAILGKPTSVEGAGTSFVTLFYKGEVRGSGSVTGTVKLMDDRIWEVNIPVF